MNAEQTALQNEQKLSSNSYPGRGIIIGMTPDRQHYVQIYWIMGRSANSQNRIFEAEGSSIKTKAFDEAKMQDPSLIIYYPLRVWENLHIVSNGDQTDTIYEHKRNGQSFETALNTREFEPDPPNYTPRISGFIDVRADTANYGLSILKSVNNDSQLCRRNYFYYSGFTGGLGHCIHTYNEDGNPLPSFDSEPYFVALQDSMRDNAEHFWSILNETNRVSLLVKYINAQDHRTTLTIINKNV